VSGLLHRVSPADLNGTTPPRIDPDAERTAVGIVEDVRTGGEESLRAHAERLGDIEPGRPLLKDREDLKSAFVSLDGETRELLVRVHQRIERFSRAQRDGLSDLTIQIEGGQAGHRWIPVSTVGAYAPGGRYPLPSSVLMTVTPARVAGVTSVWLASPRPTALVLAAAWVAGADGLLAVGGAQAVAALAFGTVSPPADLIVGPGNKWVTAAKRHLYGEVGVDGLAGPSEILVVADGSADPVLVAADLLAQAEHDTAAQSILMTDDAAFARAVEAAVMRQLKELPRGNIAGESWSVFGAVIELASLDEAPALADRIAAEHLEIATEDPEGLSERIRNAGAIFLGKQTPEMIGDYVAGSNHVLPTARSARFSSGLGVLDFMKRTSLLKLNGSALSALAPAAMALARAEGLEAHRRSAEIRLKRTVQGAA
jgi:histidinol dehydrogenase